MYVQQIIKFQTIYSDHYNDYLHFLFIRQLKFIDFTINFIAFVNIFTVTTSFLFFFITTISTYKQ